MLIVLGLSLPLQPPAMASTNPTTLPPRLPSLPRTVVVAAHAGERFCIAIWRSRLEDGHHWVSGGEATRAGGQQAALHIAGEPPAESGEGSSHCGGSHPRALPHWHSVKRSQSNAGLVFERQRNRWPSPEHDSSRASQSGALDGLGGLDGPLLQAEHSPKRLA